MRKFHLVMAAVLGIGLSLSLSCAEKVKVTAIGGAVWDGAAGVALSGATVSFTVPAEYFSDYKDMLTTATTDATGRWLLEDLPPNILIRVTVAAAGFKSYELDVLTPGEDEYREVTVTLYHYFTQDEDPDQAVYGTLYDANTGLPIAGANVHLVFRAGAVVIDTLSDAGGDFWVSGLVAEGFDLTISQTGYHSLNGRVNWCGGLNLGSPAAFDQIWCGDLNLGNLYLGSTATLAIEVADEKGNPQAAAQVILIPDCAGLCAEGVQNGATDVNGSVSFAVSLGADYEIIVVSADGTLRGSQTETVDYLATYAGVVLGVVGTDSLNIVSSNQGEESAGGVLRIVFDQPVEVVDVELVHWHDDADGDLLPDFSGVNDGAAFSLISNGYQLVISPLLSAGQVASGDEFWYSWEVRSTVTVDTLDGTWQWVEVP